LSVVYMHLTYSVLSHMGWNNNYSYIHCIKSKDIKQTNI